MNNEEIKNEARALLDKFGKDLSEIKIESKKSKSDELLLRDEKEGSECDVEFKTIMFKNARYKDDECLLAEKGSWN